jgi:hypothetical protein
MKIAVYIAGPMSKGDYLLNVRAAIDAAHVLRGLGFFPYMPQMTTLWHLVAPREYEDWMEQDFYWLGVCHAVLRLPGDSSGADREIVVARTAGIPVFDDIEKLASHFAEAVKS